VVDDAYPEWRGRATPVSPRRRLSLSLSLSALDEDCLGLAASLLFAHQNCAVVAVAAAAALFSSAPLPRAASTTASAAPSPPSSRER
jgi:hypothetical protein